MSMRTRIAADGPTFSRLAYGTWKLFDDRATATPAHLARRLETCRELGITTVDTAEIYGGYEVEELLGQALAQSPGLRQGLELVTKCGIYVPTPRHPERKVSFYNASAKRIVASVDKSLRLLKTDYVDLLLVHRPDWLTSAEDTAAGLEQVVAQGKVRHVGVSNYNVHQLELLGARLGRPLVTNQVELSLFHADAIFDGTLDQCQRLGISPMAWSPLGRGRLFNEDDEAADRVRETAAGMAEKYGGAGATELALAWVLAHPSRPVAVFGTNKVERLATIARAAELTLEREDWYALWQAAAGRRIP
jgi:predicted oxidoreductase